MLQLSRELENFKTAGLHIISITSLAGRIFLFKKAFQMILGYGQHWGPLARQQRTWFLVRKGHKTMDYLIRMLWIYTGQMIMSTKSTRTHIQKPYPFTCFDNIPLLAKNLKHKLYVYLFLNCKNVLLICIYIIKHTQTKMKGWNKKNIILRVSFNLSKL